jgi:hypothetical protein
LYFFDLLFCPRGLLGCRCLFRLLRLRPQALFLPLGLGGVLKTISFREKTVWERFRSLERVTFCAHKK